MAQRIDYLDEVAQCIVLIVGDASQGIGERVQIIEGGIGVLPHLIVGIDDRDDVAAVVVVPFSCLAPAVCRRLNVVVGVVREGDCCTGRIADGRKVPPVVVDQSRLVPQVVRNHLCVVCQ